MSEDLSAISGNSDYASFNSSAPSGLQTEREIYQLKFILVGDSNVGKTSIVNQYSINTFSPDYKASINVDFKLKTISLDRTVGAEIKIWDTCGSEKYRSLTRQYYKETHGLILTFDLTDRTSFDNLPRWLKDIEENGEEYTTIVLVGNKNDLEDKRQVSQNEIDDFAKQSQLEYVSVSAKTGASVGILFEKLANLCVKKIKDYEKEEKENKIEEEKKNNDNVGTNTNGNAVNTVNSANVSGSKKMNISKRTEKIGPFTGEITFKEKLKEENKDKNVGCC